MEIAQIRELLFYEKYELKMKCKQHLCIKSISNFKCYYGVPGNNFPKRNELSFTILIVTPQLAVFFEERSSLVIFMEDNFIPISWSHYDCYGFGGVRVNSWNTFDDILVRRLLIYSPITGVIVRFFFEVFFNFHDCSFYDFHDIKIGF